MARHNTVTVGVAATLLNALPDASRGQSSILVNVPASVTVFVGDSTVTAATGYPLVGAREFALDLADLELLYGCVASGTQPVTVLQAAV